MLILHGLEPFLGPLGPILGRLGGILAGLGASCGGLGRSLGGLGAVLGGQIGTALGKKSPQNSDQHLRWPPEATLNRFGIVWGSILDGFGIDLAGFGIDLGRFFKFLSFFLEGTF